MRILGRKALVFGGTSGIGLATVRRLLQLGAKEVVAVSRSQPLPDDVKARRVTCDVRDRIALGQLFSKEAPFDILISAATGGERSLGPFLQMDLDAYQASFDKLWGYANVVRLGSEHLSGDGCIVLVSGMPARKPKPGQVALATVGASVEQLVRCVAPELAPGRRINAVSPGIIETPLFGSDSDERSAKLAKMTEKHIVPRAGTADEVAEAILFLTQNDFVTGTVIDMDGGWLANM
eukprot:TRINITY_DN106522_c0_g1_i1.p1 TRINITY_DN106522_c0_g1~~TRINITY_DN106522_c0_g1_i1.p1  ORF type:complete len:236 (-),score=40.55 TRINITY_DN106522_c0_g1_i1:63-770(-)